jgi:Leucine-rich repeat (LRR) protein
LRGFFYARHFAFAIFAHQIPTMKKIYFLLCGLFCFVAANAQVINFPDANFKAKLLTANATNNIAQNASYQSTKIDANNDGEIQVSEAVNVYLLNINASTISNLSGIENFTSLRYLYFNQNQVTTFYFPQLVQLRELGGANNLLTSINLSGLLNLQILTVKNNQLTNIDLSGVPNLYIFDCSQNQLTDIDFSPVSNLQHLDCSYNQLAVLHLTGTNLYSLICSYNLLTALDFTGLNNLGTIYCSYNLLVDLDTSYLLNLDYLYCNDNVLTSLQLSPMLSYLDCRNNQLQELNLEGLNNLQTLACGANSLGSLDLAGVPGLTELNCYLNQLVSLDLTQVPNLQTFSCYSNQLTTLDVSNLHGLQNFYFSSNPSLISVYMKNGSNETLSFSQNPALQYICIDESQTDAVATKIIQYGYTSCLVNSYCSFVPGGTLYSITGNVRYDSDSNGCGMTDANVPLKINMASGSVTGTVFTTASGSYSSPVNAGLHTMTPALEMPAYFTVSPTSASVNFPTTASPATRNFCIARNGNHNDLEVALIPINLARPGFDATYKIIYKNKGTAAQSGSVNLAFSDAVSDLISATPSVSNQSANNLSWSFANLQPFETRSVTVTLNLNSPTETPSLHGGDVLDYSATVASSLSEETAMDNVSQLHQSVVNAFDPNDKTCLEGNTISPDMVGNYVHYVIRFENTGTANAENIVVKDMIDITKFDIASLIPLTGSHSFTTRISANKVEFIFENINLPFDDANNDGYVAFKIKTKPTLVIGDTFSNTANIYFDYNFPILTNTATTAIQLLGTPDFEFSTYFTLYPNPANNVLNIQSKDSIQLKSAQIYSMLGQLVLAVTNLENASSIDVADLTAGNYFIKIHSDKGTAATKFIKQ